MKFSLCISKFLEEISSLSHSIVFLYYFALIAKEGFLISPGYSLELCILMDISFLFSFDFCFHSFHSYLYGLLSQSFCFSLCFFFLGMVLIPVSCTMSRTFVHSSSGTLLFKVRRGGPEEIPLVQGKRNPSQTVGVPRGHQGADT